MQRKSLNDETPAVPAKTPVKPAKTAAPAATKPVDRSRRKVGYGDNAMGLVTGSLAWLLDNLSLGECHTLSRRIPAADVSDTDTAKMLINLVGQASSTVSRLSRVTGKSFSVERTTTVLQSHAILLLVCITCTGVEDDGLGDL